MNFPVYSDPISNSPISIFLSKGVLTLANVNN